MAAARSFRYETKSDIDSIEDLSKKLTADLRVHIRALGHFQPLSPRWCDMAGSLERIANITTMEKSLPKDNEDATLWECEELALRYLLEDGKLNLCLRNLVEYKELERKVWSGQKTVKPAQAEILRKFERGLGVTLRNAWEHVEALQTTDLPLLILHMSQVLVDGIARADYYCSEAAAAAAAKTGAAGGGGGSSSEKSRVFENTQEHLVVHYLKHLFRRMCDEDIEEDRIMPEVAEKHVAALLVRHLTVNAPRFSREDLVEASEALSLLFESEEFSTHPERYLEDSDKAALIGLKMLFIDDLLKENYDLKVKIRPLLDTIHRCCRQQHK